MGSKTLAKLVKLVKEAGVSSPPTVYVYVLSPNVTSERKYT